MCSVCDIIRRFLYNIYIPMKMYETNTVHELNKSGIYETFLSSVFMVGCKKGGCRGRRCGGCDIEYSIVWCIEYNKSCRVIKQYHLK